MSSLSGNHRATSAPISRNTGRISTSTTYPKISSKVTPTNSTKISNPMMMVTSMMIPSAIMDLNPRKIQIARNVDPKINIKQIARNLAKLVMMMTKLLVTKKMTLPNHHLPKQMPWSTMVTSQSK
jgi:hypothetical protein